ncbi:IS110 family transposase [Ruegeria sp. Ofav3-42]|uniref:IS110 family transposase n=1 Tax=Ruegeria sp. Ofav3-42 TaxID=2917759 RepID=UPI001EF58B2C|nr:IS110 family transposase [Ruegeria sp. Ofav3-42]MCG7522557.1 IS110 family transposase [Ruegeria sp. Ofav3-42]
MGRPSAFARRWILVVKPPLEGQNPATESPLSRNRSGECDISGGNSKAGDVNLRRALCQAANVMMNRGRSTWLRTWGPSSPNAEAVKLRWSPLLGVFLSSSIGFGLRVLRPNLM